MDSDGAAEQGSERRLSWSGTKEVEHGGTRIVVAEDEPIVRLDLCSLLESRGYDVCVRGRDGVEAVALARSTAPDLAILDVKMPRSNGIEAAREIIAVRPIPIVIVTAHRHEPDIQALMKVCDVYRVPLAINVATAALCLDSLAGRGGD